MGLTDSFRGDNHEPLGTFYIKQFTVTVVSLFHILTFAACTL